MRDADVAALMMNKRRDLADPTDRESLDLLREGNLEFRHMTGTIAWMNGDAMPAHAMEWLRFADGSEIFRLRRAEPASDGADELDWGGWAVVPSIA